jgi:hypothetical protein
VRTIPFTLPEAIMKAINGTWNFVRGILALVLFIPCYFAGWCVGGIIQAVKSGYGKGLKAIPE